MRSKRRSDARDEAYYRLTRTGPYTESETDQPSPETEALARITLSNLIRVINGFPPRCRRVFLMNKIDGLSYAEVAKVLRISTSAVEKHMMSALKRLAIHYNSHDRK